MKHLSNNVNLLYDIILTWNSGRDTLRNGLRLFSSLNFMFITLIFVQSFLSVTVLYVTIGVAAVLGFFFLDFILRFTKNKTTKPHFFEYSQKFSRSLIPHIRIFTFLALVLITLILILSRVKSLT